MKTRISCQGRKSRTTVPMIGVRPMPPPTRTSKPISPASFLRSTRPMSCQRGRGAVFARAADGDLELARQERELRVQRAPLAQDLAVRPRVDDLVGGDAGEAVAGDVPDAVAAGLDAVHVDVGEQVHHVGRVGQGDPVELAVLARREVAEAAAAAFVRAAVAAVELARDAGQRAQLLRAQLAVGNGDPRHRRVALHVPAVLQAQRAEVVVGQLAGEVALELVAELRRALMHEVAVEFVVSIHAETVVVAASAGASPRMGTRWARASRSATEPATLAAPTPGANHRFVRPVSR